METNIEMYIDNGCAENYEPIGDVCVRISDFPESFDNATDKCTSEGGYLVQYVNDEIHVSSFSEFSRIFPNFSSSKIDCTLLLGWSIATAKSKV